MKFSVDKCPLNMKEQSIANIENFNLEKYQTKKVLLM